MRCRAVWYTIRRMPDTPREPAVPLADVEVAQRIAAAAREGRPADRTPTVTQLLAAFGEDEGARPAALDRVARALQFAGVGVSPPLTEAPAGSRVTLSPGRGSSGPGGGRGRSLILGGVALAVVIAGVAVAAASLGGSDDVDRASALPPGSTQTTPVSTVQQPAPEPTRTAAEAEQAKPEQAKAEQTRTAERRRKERAAAEHRAAKKRRVVVSLTPAEPTYVCIDNADGTRVFGGTLGQRKTFRARRLRLNIGLKSVTVKVDGKPLALGGSPSGYLVQAGRAPQFLPLGQRPEC
ncbi:MAG: hypothetical protein JWO02_4269 [Solirubrobacterales bacterium]|nr:hypothetical protein [Solirubrobacterales bacterium]